MKQNRFVFLDGLRGFAAIVVLTRHAAFWHPFVFRSYLAVDLFFVLSGFVIAQSYDDRIKDGSLGFCRFLMVRFIRLYPVFLLSAVLCSLILFGAAAEKGQTSPGELLERAGAVLATLCFLPFPLKGVDMLFPVNRAYWSLFFELITNALYAGTRRYLTSRVLGIIIALSGLGATAVAYVSGTFDTGYCWSWLHLAGGFLRAVSGFSFGLLLNRHLGLLSRWTAGITPWIIFPVTGVILCSPSAGNLDWLIDAASVYVLFPLCVLIGANRSRTLGVNFLLILGSASYPIYVLHIPLAKVVSRLWPNETYHYMPYSGIIFILVLVALSLVLEKNFDIPVRRKLTDWLLRKG